MSADETTNENPTESHDTDGTTPEPLAGGTAAGTPVEGAEISEEEAEHAVEPSNDALEAEGPQAGHA